MGFFGNKNRAINLGDRVWISKEKKDEHLLSDASACVADGKIVLLAYFFTDTATFIKNALQEKNMAFAELDNVSPDIKELINLVDAELFGTQYFLDRLSLGSRETLILFAEHYPLFKKESRLVQSIQNLGKHVSYSFYMAFDEPIMIRFGADKILDMMTNMGMDKDQMISHTLITSAIENVQKKIESQVHFESLAFSPEDWFEKNMPSGVTN